MLCAGPDGTLEVWWQEHFDCFVRLEPDMKLTLRVLDQDMLLSDRPMVELGATPTPDGRPRTRASALQHTDTSSPEHRPHRRCVNIGRRLLSDRL